MKRDSMTYRDHMLRTTRLSQPEPFRYVPLEGMTNIGDVKETFPSAPHGAFVVQ